jgi:hypothetical protein
MISWDIVAVWGLQAIGAVGAIWGLFASETSKKSEATGRRRLTGRGWFAMASITLGLCGFALNQYKDKQRSDREKARIEAEERRAEDLKREAEAIKRNGQVALEFRKRDAELADVRAKAAQSQLELVKLSQAQIASSQGSLIQSQRSQIDFLSGLAMVQQNLSGVELSWPEGHALRTKIARHVRAVVDSWETDKSEDDAYLDICLSYGDLVMTRRPNYTWQVSCDVLRPLGRTTRTFEVSAGDRRANLVDALLDHLLTPNLLIRNSRGDTLVETNVGSRPTRVERRSGLYRIQLDVPRTRFSTLADPNISIQMETQDLESLPTRMRMSSRDPLARFDTQWRPEWQIRTLGSKVIQVTGDRDPEEVDPTAAVAPVRGFRVSFDGLLKPSVGSGR